MQRWLYWIDEGKGAGWIKALACFLIITLFVGYLGHKRFQGIADEAIFREAITARQLAEGKGFSTTVKDPQAVSFLLENGQLENVRMPELPEIYRPPGYSILLASGLLLGGESGREWLFEPPLPRPERVFNAYRADYYLLAVNLAGFLLLLGLTCCFAWRLWGKAYALVALFALTLSTGWWQTLILLDGSTWLASALLLIFWSLFQMGEESTTGRKACIFAGVVGGILGLLFHFEYYAILLLPAVVTYIYLCLDRREKHVVSLILTVTALLVITPWLWRNVVLTGHPLALGWQEIAWRIGDPTAEPVLSSSLLSSDTAEISPRKSINKALSNLENYLGTTFWQAGGVFAAFFIASLLFRFRNANVDRLKYLALGSSLLLYLLEGIMTSGNGLRSSAVWASPIIIILGAGFCAVLVNNRTSIPWQRGIIVAIILFFHSISLFQDILEPRRQPFSYPPYSPTVMAITHHQLEVRFRPAYRLMADLPAGTAWYSQTTVWQQPVRYGDFQRLQALEPTGALLLTTETLNRPYFSQLTRSQPSTDDSRRTQWSDVYAGLTQGELPITFPLSEVNPITDAFFILVNPDARR